MTAKRHFENRLKSRLAEQVTGQPVPQGLWQKIDHQLPSRRHNAWWAVAASLVLGSALLLNQGTGSGPGGPSLSAALLQEEVSLLDQQLQQAYLQDAEPAHINQILRQRQYLMDVLAHEQGEPL